jgi:hypothetical protein
MKLPSNTTLNNTELFNTALKTRWAANYRNLFQTTCANLDIEQHLTHMLEQTGCQLHVLQHVESQKKPTYAPLQCAITEALASSASAKPAPEGFLALQFEPAHERNTTQIKQPTSPSLQAAISGSEVSYFKTFTFENEALAKKVKAGECEDICILIDENGTISLESITGHAATISKEKLEEILKNLGHVDYAWIKALDDLQIPGSNERNRQTTLTLKLKADDHHNITFAFDKKPCIIEQEAYDMLTALQIEGSNHPTERLKVLFSNTWACLGVEDGNFFAYSSTEGSYWINKTPPQTHYDEQSPTIYVEHSGNNINPGNHYKVALQDSSIEQLPTFTLQDVCGDGDCLLHAVLANFEYYASHNKLGKKLKAYLEAFNATLSVDPHLNLSSNQKATTLTQADKFKAPQAHAFRAYLIEYLSDEKIFKQIAISISKTNYLQAPSDSTQPDSEGEKNYFDLNDLEKSLLHRNKNASKAADQNPQLKQPKQPTATTPPPALNKATIFTVLLILGTLVFTLGMKTWFTKEMMPVAYQILLLLGIAVSYALYRCFSESNKTAPPSATPISSTRNMHGAHALKQAIQKQLTNQLTNQLTTAKVTAQKQTIDLHFDFNPENKENAIANATIMVQNEETNEEKKEKVTFSIPVEKLDFWHCRIVLNIESGSIKAQSQLQSQYNTSWVGAEEPDKGLYQESLQEALKILNPPGKTVDSLPIPAAAVKPLNAATANVTPLEAAAAAPAPAATAPS